MSGQLFAAIRRGKVKPGMADEFAKRVKAGALPVMPWDLLRPIYLTVWSGGEMSSKASLRQAPFQAHSLTTLGLKKPGQATCAGCRTFSVPSGLPSIQGC
jgi:hypothetical protein